MKPHMFNRKHRASKISTLSFVGLSLLCGFSFFFGCTPGLEKRTPLPGRAVGFSGPSFGTPLTSGLRPSQIAPSSSLPSLDEEIWVIARRAEDSPQRDEATPETGALLAKVSEQSKPVPLP